MARKVYGVFDRYHHFFDGENLSLTEAKERAAYQNKFFDAAVTVSDKRQMLGAADAVRFIVQMMPPRFQVNLALPSGSPVTMALTVLREDAYLMAAQNAEDDGRIWFVTEIGGELDADAAWFGGHDHTCGEGTMGRIIDALHDAAGDC